MSHNRLFTPGSSNNVNGDGEPNTMDCGVTGTLIVLYCIVSIHLLFIMLLGACIYHVRPFMWFTHDGWSTDYGSKGTSEGEGQSEKGVDVFA